MKKDISSIYALVSCTTLLFFSQTLPERATYSRCRLSYLGHSLHESFGKYLYSQLLIKL
jgi:hypothetical protein